MVRSLATVTRWSAVAVLLVALAVVMVDGMEDDPINAEALETLTGGMTMAEVVDVYFAPKSDDDQILEGHFADQCGELCYTDRLGQTRLRSPTKFEDEAAKLRKSLESVRDAISKFRKAIKAQRELMKLRGDNPDDEADAQLRELEDGLDHALRVERRLEGNVASAERLAAINMDDFYLQLLMARLSLSLEDLEEMLEEIAPSRGRGGGGGGDGGDGGGGGGGGESGGAETGDGASHDEL